MILCDFVCVYMLTFTGSSCQDDIKLGKNVKIIKNISFSFIGYKSVQGKKK